MEYTNKDKNVIEERMVKDVETETKEEKKFKTFGSVHNYKKARQSELENGNVIFGWQTQAIKVLANTLPAPTHVSVAARSNGRLETLLLLPMKEKANGKGSYQTIRINKRISDGEEFYDLYEATWDAQNKKFIKGKEIVIPRNNLEKLGGLVVQALYWENKKPVIVASDFVPFTVIDTIADLDKEEKVSEHVSTVYKDKKWKVDPVEKDGISLSAVITKNERNYLHTTFYLGVKAQANALYRKIYSRQVEEMIIPFGLTQHFTALLSAIDSASDYRIDATGKPRVIEVQKGKPDDIAFSIERRTIFPLKKVYFKYVPETDKYTVQVAEFFVEVNLKGYNGNLYPLKETAFPYVISAFDELVKKHKTSELLKMLKNYDLKKGNYTYNVRLFAVPDEKGKLVQVIYDKHEISRAELQRMFKKVLSYIFRFSLDAGGTSKETMKEVDMLVNNRAFAARFIKKMLDENSAALYEILHYLIKLGSYTPETLPSELAAKFIENENTIKEFARLLYSLITSEEFPAFISNTLTVEQINTLTNTLKQAQEEGEEAVILSSEQEDEEDNLFGAPEVEDDAENVDSENIENVDRIVEQLWNNDYDELVSSEFSDDILP